jgi:two-component system response regulator RegX3
MKPTILVVEDEAPIRDGLCDLLAYHGFAPTPVATGTEGLKEALEGTYDLLLLDVMLPGVDGFEICRTVREAWPGQAILMLTAKGREEDILEGFRAGCDDYVPKPFSIAQLLARVRALLRRASDSRGQVFTTGPLAVDMDNLEACVGERKISLTPRDVGVLSYLYAERHRVVRREDLLREVWEYQRVDAVETRCVDMHMVKLRRKLARLLGEAEVIQTVRGAGYRFLAPEGD